MKNKIKYKIAAPDHKEHDCQIVVLRPTNHSLRKPIIHFLKFMKISTYDLVTFFGGPMNLLSEDAEIFKEAIAPLKISRDLHNAKEIYLFSFVSKKEARFVNHFDEKYSDRNVVISDLKKTAEISAKETGLKVRSFFIEISEDEKDMNFYEVSNRKEKEVFVWPYIPKAKESIVIRCMDFRFREPTKVFLENIMDLTYYDLVSIPGAGKGIIERAKESLAYKSLESAILDHGVKKVILINHMDCGAYGGHKNFENLDSERDFMCGESNKAKGILEENFPNVEFIYLLQFFKDGNLEFLEI